MAITGDQSKPSNTPGRVDVEKALLGGSTYRGLAEQKLSPAEERFEKARRTAGFFLAPLATIIVFLLPLDIPQTQHNVAAVLAGVIVAWVTEPIPIPVSGLLGASLLVLLGAGGDEGANGVLAPFGSGTVFTFIGAFILAQSMLVHGLARRFAFRILSVPGVARSSLRIVIAFGFITCLLSAWISNTATVAILMPTAVGILGVIGNLVQDKHEAEGTLHRFDPTRMRVGFAMMLMLAYGASVGGLLTPVGSPPNLIGRELIEKATDKPIPFGTWMAMAFPICALMFVGLAVVLLLLNRPEVRHLTGVEEYVHRERAALGRMSRAEKNTLFAFTVTVVLWVFPAVVGLVVGTGSSAYETASNNLDEGVAAVLGAALLFVLPTDWKAREFTLRWGDAARIDWGTIVLFGSGVVFGTLLEETGLAETIGKGAFGALNIGSAVAITVFGALLAIVVSETTSNTASAAVVVPIVIPLAVAAGVDPLTPALAATFAASFGFMLPVSTPQNAIVYGSGTVPITKMIRSGISFDIVGALLIIVLLPLLAAALL
ncbi:DASS family sodium-coupled anion symporter [Streptomyces sp. WMMB 322]|uniref:SLC13 family permease n=1 Tax=Streptomyces sp. WMMB 322 TaxID=1286821 RepID=UPI0006E381F8|nr:DASS family sodium-coupled anion symporter [Streptomyces sp. WMMB 322]SCK07079.1 solute carrier family 13 (sodium-dependent dicarboxylate transporter), member 2/3/5 [Streptomyces sp. WMMB 322]